CTMMTQLSLISALQDRETDFSFVSRLAAKNGVETAEFCTDKHGGVRGRSGRRARFLGQSIRLERAGTSNIQCGMPSDLSPLEERRLHMMKLLLRLPAAGVAEAWPTEAACRDRLIVVRWPGGVRCPRCDSTQIGVLEKRQIYHCKSCRLQFTAQSHSILHRSHVELQKWFRTTELLIWHNAHHPNLNYPTGHDLKDDLEISYAAAHAIRKKILSDLFHADGGLLGRCVAVGPPVSAPADISVGGPDELLWFHTRVTT
ncbi:MAG: transposase, partial [Paracoccus sp. (in: a-proteobacteria)]